MRICNHVKLPVTTGSALKLCHRCCFEGLKKSQIFPKLSMCDYATLIKCKTVISPIRFPSKSHTHNKDGVTECGAYSHTKPAIVTIVQTINEPSDQEL